MVRTRAHFRAAWWDDPRLGATVGTWFDADAMDRYLQRLADELKRFTDRVGDRMPRERRDLYDRLLVAAPRLSSAIPPIAISRSFRETRTSGIAFCLRMARATMSVSSIEIAGASTSAPTISRI
jgi:hypothetical protein